MQIITGLLDTFQQLFEKFTLSRLFSLIVLGVIAVFMLFAWDTTTGFFYFSSQEKKTALLKELYDLKKDGVTQDPELKSIYDDLVSDLDSHKTYPISELPYEFSSSLGNEKTMKFISGGLIGWLLALSALSDRAKGVKAWKNTVIGGIFYGVMFGVIGNSIPIVISPLVNYVGWPILQIIIVLGLSRLVSVGKNQTKSPVS